MKKLYLSVDSRNRELPIWDSSSYINYYTAPSGSDVIQIPPEASYVEIMSASDIIWYRIGDENVTAVAPTADVIDGTSPRFIPAFSSVIHRILEETHISIESAGGVVISYWRQ